MAKEPQTIIRGATRGGREGMHFWAEFVQKLEKILYFVSPYDGPQKMLQAIEATPAPREYHASFARGTVASTVVRYVHSAELTGMACGIHCSPSYCSSIIPAYVFPASPSRKTHHTLKRG